MVIGRNGDSAAALSFSAAHDASLKMTISVQMMLLLREPRAPAAVRALAYLFIKDSMAMIERTALEAESFAGVAEMAALKDRPTTIYLSAAEQVIHADSMGKKPYQITS